ncbi:hypothetical protein K3495_g13906 [Podosphaera aphanis]|nr:hypothetical protein K3495_g13906 [Podosphaera aphanis]
MLKDAALQHYHDTFSSENLPDLSTLYQTMKLNFEGKEYQQSMLIKWNEISLKTTLQDVESTDVEVALNSLITNLRHFQMSLSPEFQSDKILFAKLLQVCRTHPSCSIAYSTVADETAAGLINRLRSNVARWKAQQNSMGEQFFQDDQNEAVVHFTDRRYHKNNANRSRQNNQITSNHNERYQRNDRQRKICFVCRKEGCWSTRHSESERRQARKRLRDAYNYSQDSYNRNDNRRFLTDIDSDESTINAFIQQYVCIIYRLLWARPPFRRDIGRMKDI